MFTTAKEKLIIGGVKVELTDQLHSMAKEDEEHSYSTIFSHVHIGHQTQA